MRTNVHQTVQFGELVVAAFDRAARFSTDPREVSRLATSAVVHMLRHAQQTSPAPKRLSSPDGGVLTVGALIAERPKGENEAVGAGMHRGMGGM